jgi:hypothetical protein
MVVRYIAKSGMKVMGPPYTDAEVREMFRRMQNGPRMMTRIGSATAQKADPAVASTSHRKPAKSR